MERLLRGPGPSAGAGLPDWFLESQAAFREQVLDPAYPCYFGTAAEKAGDLYYTYVDDDPAGLLGNLVEFARLTEASPGRRLTLATFFPPAPPGTPHREYRQRVWRALQRLLDADPWAWPESEPADPEHPLWELSLGGNPYFVFAAAPSYRRRRSRNLGPSLVLLFQPRSAFFGIETDRPAGQRARQKIRSRLEAWDGVAAHADLRDYGDPEGREWKQIFLPDDDAPVRGRCPLNLGPGPGGHRPPARAARSGASSLVEVLRYRAGERPDGTLFRFLERGEVEAEALTYGELDLRARAVAASLQARVEPGDRALLLFPPGLEFIVAFFGCLYAGVVAVPCYPPSRKHGMDRIRSFAADARPALVLAPESLLSRVDDRERRLLGTGDEPAWLALLGGDPQAANDWRPPDLGASTLAFLQYTSGSTAAPKGVMVSHGNLLHNQEAIRRAFSQSEESVVVGWLPLYHDMGLIGNVLQPLYVGGTCILMSPLAFLQKPARWLEAISRYRATTSGGPDFAYELCTRRVTEPQREALDLSTWTIAFNGAEPVRARTLEVFARTFATAGFESRAFRPCYGLAESTLLVSCGGWSDPAARAQLAPEALASGRVEVAPPDRPARVLVGCGEEAEGQEIAVVDPETRRRAPAGRVGEIWVGGPSIAGGYWGRPEETREVFDARLEADGGGPFLRTGDLGFLHQGRLFVTGRLKDLLILRGRNHYPQDLEASAEASHSALRPGCSVAFSLEVDGEERLHLVLEVEREWDGDVVETVRAVRRRVAEEQDVHVYGIVLARRGAVPKTSSGKLRRRACRDSFLAGELDVVATSLGDDGEEPGAVQESPGRCSASSSETVNPVDRAEVLARTRHRIASALGSGAGALGPDESLASLGLDSLMAVDLKSALEEEFSVPVPLEEILRGPTPRELAERVGAGMIGGSAAGLPALDPQGPPAGPYPLSYGQKALWFLQQVAADSAAYHVVAVVRIRGRLDVAALRGALRTLVERHPCLRTTFEAPDGEPLQRIHDHLEPGFLSEDAAAWTEAALDRRLAEEAHAPFDLERGPLVRCALFRRSGREHVAVLAFHHLIVDFWSLALLVRELDHDYRLAVRGASAPLEPQEVHYADFVRWQQRVVEGAHGARLWSYWRERLGGRTPHLELPTDRPRPRVQSYDGASIGRSLDPVLASRLHQLARRRGATFYCVLLSAYYALLHRYSAQDDVVCGSPAAGRTLPGLAGVVGYLVNPLVLRADLSANPSFHAVLSQVRRTVAEALDHQEFPFALLAERLQPVRDPGRSPLFQVMFVLQRAQAGTEAAVAGLALGESGARLGLGGLDLESIGLERRPAQFDLTLSVCESTTSALATSLHFNTGLFDASTAVRMLGHFATILEGIVEDPSARIGRLPLLTTPERRQALIELNDTDVAASPAQTIQGQVRRQADARPDATALVFGEEAWTFGELVRRSGRVAAVLDALELPLGSIVALHLERSPDMVAGLLGILEAGHAFLPLDPSYPAERLRHMLADSEAQAVLTAGDLAAKLPPGGPKVVRVELQDGAVSGESSRARPGGGSLAYVNYTSGSTGRPKGVLVSHRSVLNFFAGMDGRIGCGPGDTLLAVTSISFDISVLELFWTLARGARVVLPSHDAALHVADTPEQQRRARPVSPCDLSLFYFASLHDGQEAEKYRLLLDGARLADANGFKAVWTPERHFHAFGGLYPNPSVTSAALATITRSVELRAGSVVLPLHNPLRVAEEWAVVDNLSGGRVGIAFASGWHADDFVLRPEGYADRKELMFRDVETVRRLWRGEAVTLRGGAGNEVEVSVLPRPLQAELPVWITAAGSPETFVRAGEIGAHVLTHLLGQSVEELAERIALYRGARKRFGHDPDAGRVSLMLHTFVDRDRERVRKVVRKPFTDYLRSSVGLIRNLARSLELDLDLDSMKPADMDDLLAFAFDRYFETSALFGDLDGCATMLEGVRRAGVDEAACLIDFGVEPETALDSLKHLARLTRPSTSVRPARRDSFLTMARRWQPTLLQSTPSFIALLEASGGDLSALRCLRALLLGGEALPAPLARRLGSELGVPLVNLYGPTETTVWSASQVVTGDDESVPLGRPIANTDLHVLDRHLEPLPPRVVGEIFIGGDGVAYGYLGQPGPTAERFLPHPFARGPGRRIYRTGDLGSRRPGGLLDFHGRADQQVKIRGHRVELGEIEAVLGEHAQVGSAAARFWHGPGEPGLVAYWVSADGAAAPTTEEFRRYLAARLPEVMLPQRFVSLDHLPRTLNGKLDRASLPRPDQSRPEVGEKYMAPASELERTIAAIWREVLGVEKVGMRDNFFDLGGHSLLMAVAHRKLQDRLKVEIPLVKLLEHPKVGTLADFLSREQVETFSVEPARERAMRQVASRGRRRSSPPERMPET